MKKQDKLEENRFSGTAMRQILRRAKTCTLSTLSKDDGTPYGSLANIATDRTGNPVLLLSKLAWHTQNLLADGKASVLVAELPEGGDALVGPRVTVLGRLAQSVDVDVHRRYLAHHPLAKLYAEFADFSFWVMSPTIVHGIAGFGRIETHEPETVFPAADEFAALEHSAIEHLNHDHADAIHLYATRILRAHPGDWQVTAIDPDGCNLGLNDQCLRLDFANPVFTADALRKEFSKLAYEARNSTL
jgi:putative heme iron utilization protein